MKSPAGLKRRGAVDAEMVFGRADQCLGLRQIRFSEAAAGRGSLGGRVLALVDTED